MASTSTNSKNVEKLTHPVMLRVPVDSYNKLLAIAAHDDRPHGPQALRMLNAAIDEFIKSNPALKKKFRLQK